MDYVIREERLILSDSLVIPTLSHKTLGLSPPQEGSKYCLRMF